MKINFQETTTDLATRIDIHSKFGSKDIDQWMLEILKLQLGMSILDVGCGAGKQCFSYHSFLQGNAKITGGDVSQDLLNQAIQEDQKRKSNIKFIDLDFNTRFPFEDDQFDLASCCFAIYYAEDVPFTIREMHRVLKSGGKLFTTGPMPNNKQLFYEIIKEATHKPIPPMPGSSRYYTEFLSAIQTIFSKVEVHIFENPLVFESVEPFIAYTRASLSEDRKLWKNLFEGHEGFEETIKEITKTAEKRLARDGKLIMTKVVGGFLATK
jgi:ubiquinone/menaquinone biosynthesis C-methylase UbiE